MTEYLNIRITEYSVTEYSIQPNTEYPEYSISLERRAGGIVRVPVRCWMSF
ncbi:MAG: hypothetical protein GY820_45360 [Gammaproteobacteria bacterium]|nr:hypothetical protein [Gammaproteobacteria bacterium]